MKTRKGVSTDGSRACCDHCPQEDPVTKKDSIVSQSREKGPCVDNDSRDQGISAV